MMDFVIKSDPPSAINMNRLETARDAFFKGVRKSYIRNRGRVDKTWGDVINLTNEARSGLGPYDQYILVEFLSAQAKTLAEDAYAKGRIYTMGLFKMIQTNLDTTFSFSPGNPDEKVAKTNVRGWYEVGGTVRDFFRDIVVSSDEGVGVVISIPEYPDNGRVGRFTNKLRNRMLGVVRTGDDDIFDLAERILKDALIELRSRKDKTEERLVQSPGDFVLMRYLRHLSCWEGDVYGALEDLYRYRFEGYGKDD